MPDTFCERLRTLRKRAGLTQEKLADLIGVHETTIRRWEKNERQPRISEIKALAKALGVSENDLLNDPPPEHSGEWTIHINVADKFTKEVIDLTGNIQPIAQITVTPDGIAFTVKSDWEKLKTEAGLKQLFKQVLKAYPAMRNNGVALGAIKD